MTLAYFTIAFLECCWKDASVALAVESSFWRVNWWGLNELIDTIDATHIEPKIKKKMCHQWPPWIKQNISIVNVHISHTPCAIKKWLLFFNPHPQEILWNKIITSQKSLFRLIIFFDMTWLFSQVVNKIGFLSSGN